jgi:REP element-mobilizing transposase RayT
MITDRFQQKYRISSARLSHYDYATAGLYFVTINAKDHQCIFGRIDAESQMHHSTLGDLVERCWIEIPEHFPHVELDVFQVMPNHFHGILHLTASGETDVSINEEGRRPGGMQRGAVDVILNSFKGAVTRESRKQALAKNIWQPRFHDHVIRDEKDLERIRHYIANNVGQWTQDRYYRES